MTLHSNLPFTYCHLLHLIDKLQIIYANTMFLLWHIQAGIFKNGLRISPSSAFLHIHQSYIYIEILKRNIFKDGRIYEKSKIFVLLFSNTRIIVSLIFVICTRVPYTKGIGDIYETNSVLGDKRRSPSVEFACRCVST